MKILQVNKLYSPWLGGVETVAQDIAEFLNAKHGLSVTNLVCQPRGKRKSECVNGVETIRARSWGMISGMPISFDFLRLFRNLAKDADLIILHHPFPLGFIGYLLFGRGKKLIVWYHSDIVRQRLTKLPFIPFIRYGLSSAQHIAVSTKAMIRTSDLLKDFVEKCRVIYFGVDIERFQLTDEIEKKASEIRTAYGEPLVLSVGRLVYYKGFQYLISAMKEVPANLLIIGKGPLKGMLLNEVAEAGVHERVHLIDPVQDLVPYFHACDMFAFPSCEPSEAFGLVQIEALACGKPVVNTNLPSGVPEVSVGGITGRTVPAKSANSLSNAIREILFDDVEYKRLSRNARTEVAERFSKARFFAELDDIICRQ